MKTDKNGVKTFSRKSDVISRRKRVIEKLEAQLKAGTKVGKGATPETLPLLDVDIKRIKNELSILNSRLN